MILIFALAKLFYIMVACMAVVKLEQMQQLDVNGRFYTVKGIVPFIKQ